MRETTQITSSRSSSRWMASRPKSASCDTLRPLNTPRFRRRRTRLVCRYNVCSELAAGTTERPRWARSRLTARVGRKSTVCSAALRYTKETSVLPAVGALTGWPPLWRMASEQAKDRHVERQRRRARYRRQASRPAPDRPFRRAAAEVDPALSWLTCFRTISGASLNL